MSIDDQMKLLTKNEMIVLYWKCKGLNYEQIRLRLTYSKDWVQLQMSTVYAKLGFEKSMHWTKRVEILNREVCPRLPKNIDDWKPIEAITEGITEESTEQVIESKVDPEMLALVVYDEMELEKKKNTALIPPQEKVIVIDETKKEENPWGKFLRRLLFAVVSLLIVSAIAYFAYNFGRGAAPMPQTVIITATFPPLTDTPLSSPTSPAPTETLVPTSTSTPVPTNTAVPTEFIPPADGILFQDDFESGDLSAWTQYGGNWIIANNQLSIVGEDTDSYRWIALNRPEWKNYILSLKVNIPFQGSAAQSDVAIAVRNAGSQSAYLAVHIDTIRNRPYWAFVEGNSEDSVAGLNEGTYFESGSTMELIADGDTYTLRVNGREIQKITMSGYNSGGISLGIYCYIEMGCPSFDNVKITYLP